MATKEKLYARITDYGDLLVPIEQLEKILNECYLVRTSYENSEDVISEVKNMQRCRFHVHAESELKTAIATQKLAE
jgi:hypothetical protein